MTVPFLYICSQETPNHDFAVSAIKCSKTVCNGGTRMKKLGNNVLLILFCIGIIGGLILPRWLSINSNLDFSILNIRSFRQYIVVETDYRAVLRSALRSRLTLMLLLFFSCYTAAGFWILAGTYLVMGLFFGLLSVLSVVQMQYWGIVFLLCAVLPQWLLYGMAGVRLGEFMEKRKKRMALCNVNAIPSYNLKTFFDFLTILVLTCGGIASEVYVNPWMLRYFLNFYLAKLT